MGWAGVPWVWGPGAKGALPCPIPCRQELVGGERAQQCLQWGRCTPQGPSPCPFPIPTSRSHPSSAVSSPPVTLSAPFVPRCLISAPALGFWPCPSSGHRTPLMLQLLSAPGFIYTQILIFSSSPAVELQVYVFNSGPEFPAPGLHSAPALHLRTRQLMPCCQLQVPGVCSRDYGLHFSSSFLSGHQERGSASDQLL